MFVDDQSVIFRILGESWKLGSQIQVNCNRKIGRIELAESSLQIWAQISTVQNRSCHRRYSVFLLLRNVQPAREHKQLIASGRQSPGPCTAMDLRKSIAVYHGMPNRVSRKIRIFSGSWKLKWAKVKVAGTRTEGFKHAQYKRLNRIRKFII